MGVCLVYHWERSGMESDGRCPSSTLVYHWEGGGMESDRCQSLSHLQGSGVEINDHHHCRHHLLYRPGH